MVTLSFTIPDEKLTQFKEAFFIAYPKPVDFQGTDLDWVKEFIKRKLYRVYSIGRSYDFKEEIEIT